MAALILISWATLTQICLFMQRIFSQYILCPQNFPKDHKYSEEGQVPNIMDWHHHCEERRINKRANTFKPNCQLQVQKKKKKKAEGEWRDDSMYSLFYIGTGNVLLCSTVAKDMLFLKIIYLRTGSKIIF